MDNEQVKNIVAALVKLAESSTYQCDSAGAENITSLLMAARRLIESLELSFEAEDVDVKSEGEDNE